MKTTIKGMALLAMAAMVTFTSCSDDDQQPLTPGTARVQGRITAKMDMTSHTISSVPQGTTVSFIIDSRDLDKNPDPNFVYDKIITQATVDADGFYTVDLPVGNNAVNVEVVYNDFEFDATVIVTDDQGFQTSQVIRKVYTAPTETISLSSGQVKVMDRSYNMCNNCLEPSALIRGQISARFRDNRGPVTNRDAVNAGTGYSTGNNVTANGGSGTGLTVDVTNVDANGEVLSFNINNQGTGYTIGDVLTISGGGNNATFVVTAVGFEEENVPAGVVLTFVTNNGNGNAYRVATDNQGRYIVRLPVTGTDNIQVRFADFEQSSVYDNNGTFVTGPKVYGRSNATISIAEDNIRDFDYSYNRVN
jgi:hypothetical protein